MDRLGYMGGLDPKWITEQKVIGFPHPHVPSDHVPIMAQYALRPIANRPSPARATRYRRLSEDFKKQMDRFKGSSID